MATGAWIGLIITGGIVLYCVATAGPRQEPAKPVAVHSQHLDGLDACARADHPPPEARARYDATNALDDLAVTLDGLGTKLTVSGLQRQLDEATLAGDAEQANKLHADLSAAKQERDLKEAEIARRRAIRDSHKQALQDIADCRKFHGED
jgi:hypothetical protein